MGSIISTVTTIVFIVVFVLLILGLVLAGLIGYKRGVFAATWRAIFLGVCILASFLSLKGIAFLFQNIPLNVPLGWFGIESFPISNTIDGETITSTVNISTVFGTLRSLISSLFVVFKVDIPHEQISDIAISLSMSIINLFAFGFEMLMVVIFGNIFATILWHAIIKRFIAKSVRKKVRLPWLSLFENIITYVVVAALFISPLSGILNAVNRAYQSNKNLTNNDETVQTIDKFFTSYENSPFAKVFLNWTADESGMTLDTRLLNEICKYTSGDATVSIVDTLYSITEIASNSLNIVSFKDENNNSAFIVDYSLMFTEEYLENVFEAIKKSSLITSIIPVAAEIALKSEVISTYIEGYDPSLLDDLINLDEISWNDEIDCVKRAAIAVSNSGVLNKFLDDNGQFKNNVDAKEVIKYSLMDDNFDSLMNAVRSINDSKMLQALIPIEVNAVVNNIPEAKDYMPSTWEEIKSIEWGFELETTLSCVHDLYKVDEEIIDVVFEMIDSSSVKVEEGPVPQKGSSLEEEEENTPISKLLTLFTKNYDAYADILVGKRNNGELDKSILDENGKTIVYNQNGSLIEGRKYCFLDLEISDYICAAALQALSETINKGESAEKEINDVIQEMNSGKKMLNYKEEINSVLYTLGSFTNDTDSVTKLLDGSLFNDILTIDDKTSSMLANAIERMDNSKILSALVFPIVTDMLEDSDSEIIKTFESFDIDADLIKEGVANAREEKHLGNELAKLVRILPYVGDIKEITTNGLTPAEMVNKAAEKYESLAYILEGIADCKIINPDAEKTNLISVLNFVFKNVSESFVIDPNYDTWISEVNWMSSRDENGKFLKNAETGDPEVMSECYAMAKVIKLLGANKGTSESPSSLMDVLSSSLDFSNKTNISDLENKYHISDLLKAFDYSEFFKLHVGDYLDETLSSSGLINHNVGISFTNVTSWKQEGDKLGNILLALGDAQFDFNNLDLTAINDVVGLNNLLHRLEESSLFVDKTSGKSLFGKWIFSLLAKEGTGLTNVLNGSNLLLDPEDMTPYKISGGIYAENANEDPFFSSDINYLKYSMLYNDLLNITNWNEMSEYKTDYKDDYWLEPGFFEEYEPILDEDVIGKICKVAYLAGKVLNDNNGEMLTDVLSIDADGIIQLAQAINETEFLRISIYRLFEIVKNTIPSDMKTLFNLDNANIEALLKYENESDMVNLRNEEIASLGKLIATYQLANSKGLLDSGTFDLNALDEEMINSLNESLKALYESKVFHVAGPVTTAAYYNPTVFQSLFASIIFNTFLKDYIYLSVSPKDQAFEDVYERYEAPSGIATSDVGAYRKIAYIMDQHFTNKFDNYESIEQFIEILRAFVGVGDYVGLHLGDELSPITFEVSDIDISESVNILALEEILNAVNDSSILYDIVPNMLNKFLVSADSLFASLSGDIFASAAESSFYIYTEASSTANYSLRYEREEISNIIGILESYGEFSKIVSNISDLNNLSKVDLLFDGDEGIVFNLLKSMYKSKIMHKSNINNNSNTTNLTAFEETVFMLLDESNLTSYINNGNLGTSKANIKAVSSLDNDAFAINETGYHNKWLGNGDDELHALVKALKTGVDVIKDAGGLDFNLQNVSLNTLRPESVKNLMFSINRVDMLDGVLPSFIKDGFTSISFSNLSSFNGVDKANYDIGQRAFGGTALNVNNLSSNTEIMRLYSLLNSFSNKDSHGNFTSYVTLNDPESLINTDGLMATLLDFIKNSDLYQKQITVSGVSVTTRGLFLFNVLDTFEFDGGLNVTSYVANNGLVSTTDGQKMYTLDAIIKSFDPKTEEAGIKSLLTQKDDILSISELSGDEQSLNDNKELISGLLIKAEESRLVNNTYNRSYLLSEISAGLLNKAIVLQEEGFDKPFKVTRFGLPSYDSYAKYLKGSNSINNYSTRYYDEALDCYYVPVGRAEAEGLEGIVDVIKPIKSIRSGNFAEIMNINKDELKANFAKMDGSYFSRFVYLKYAHYILDVGTLLPVRNNYAGVDGMRIYTNEFMDANGQYGGGFTSYGIALVSAIPGI